jgi:hypothetical protein
MLRLWIVLLLAAGQERVVETVISGAPRAEGCTATIEIANAGSRIAAVELHAHRESGAVVALPAGAAAFGLHPGEHRTFPVETAAWIGVRERVDSAEQPPAVSARGVTDCVAGDHVLTAARESAYAMRNPWYAGEVATPGAVILLVNTSDAPARVSACYSAGNLYSVPSAGGGPPAFEPVCSEMIDVQVPPFATHEFPVERGGNRWFGLRTHGRSIVLQMLRPADDSRRTFLVDSTIRFGGEVTSR